MIKIPRGNVLFYPDMAAAFLRVFFGRKESKASLVREFETAFSRYIGTRYAVAVSSGKIALYLSLRALNALPGQEIIVPAYTVPEVVEVIVAFGLIPVFVDVSLEDANMDPRRIKDKIGEKTKFILMTHIHGCPCAVETILEISAEYNLRVIEDAAQACGAEYRGKKTGNFGVVAYFSFGMLKNINTLGGGMIVTDDAGIAEYLRGENEKLPAPSRAELAKRLIKSFFLFVLTNRLVFSFFVYPLLWLMKGSKERLFAAAFKAPLIDQARLEGLKLKFAAAQAAIGLLEIKKVDQRNEAKINNAEILRGRLGNDSGIKLPKNEKETKNIYFNFTARVKNRDKFIADVFEKGVDLTAGFVTDCSGLERFRSFGAECPNSRQICREQVYLPVDPSLNRQDMLRIADTIRERNE